MDALPDGAILFIPGAANSRDDYERPEALEAIAWLGRVVTPEQTLCAVCSAALLAARAGLLAGRDCTTHFSLQERLARIDPSLRVLPNRLFVSDGNIITSAGAASGIDNGGIAARPPARGSGADKSGRGRATDGSSRVRGSRARSHAATRRPEGPSAGAPLGPSTQGKTSIRRIRARDDASVPFG